MEEKVIDKNMGTKKVTVTKEKFLEEKEKRVKHESIERLQKLNNFKKHNLSDRQNSYIEKVLELYRKGKLTDSFLIHFVERKLEYYEEYQGREKEVKKLQMDLLQKINQVTDEVIKCKNNMEFIDKEIAQYVEKNLHLIEE